MKAVRIERAKDHPVFIGGGIDRLVVGSLLLAVLGVGLFERSTYQRVGERVRDRVTHAARLEASDVSHRLETRIMDLGMMASIMLDRDSQSVQTDRGLKHSIRIFLGLHPSLVEFEVFRTRDGTLIWSTSRFSGAFVPPFPGKDLRDATPVPSNKIFFIGKSRYSPRLGSRLLPLTYLKENEGEKRPFGFRTDLRVADLIEGSSPAQWHSLIRDVRDGTVLLSSGETSFVPNQSPPGESVMVAIPDSPFAIEASWPSSLVVKEWVGESPSRWGLEGGGLLALFVMGWGIRRLVRRKEEQNQELSELSDLNEAIFDTAEAIGMVIDRSGRILRLNRSARDFMGVSLEEIREIPYYWERFLPPEFKSGDHALFKGAGEDSPPVNAEYPWISLTGERRIFDWSNAVIREASGRPLYVVTLGIDVTERRTLDRALEEKNRHLERLLAFDVLRGRVAEAVARANDEREIMAEFCRLATEVPGIRLVWVGRPDETGLFHMLATAGEVGYLEGVVISERADLPDGQGPAGRAWREGASVYNSSFETSPFMRPWRQRARRFGIASSATQPVHRNGKIWAVMTVYLDREEPFDSGLRLLLDAIAENLSLALDRIDLATRERSATLLKDILLANTTAGIVLIRYPERVVIEANQGFLEIMGHESLAEIVGRPLNEGYFVEEDRARVRVDGVRQALEMGAVRLRDVRLIRANGEEGYFDLSGEKLKGGEAETVIWTVIDVTERHALSRDLERLSDFNALLAQVNQAIAEVRDESMLLQTICDLLVDLGKLKLAWIGLPAENGVIRFLASSGEKGFIEGLEISVDRSHPHGRGAVEKVWHSGTPLFDFNLNEAYAGTELGERILQYGLVGAAVLPVIRENKTWGLLTLYLDTKRFDPALQGVLSEMARDVSRGLDRLEALHREQESAAFRKVLLKNTLAGIVLLENRKIRFANDRMIQMFGYDKAESLVGQSIRILYARSDEYERVGFAYSLLPGRESLEIPDVFMVKKDGTPLMVDISITPIPDSSSVVGTIHDVTDRHLQTEKLRLLSAYNTLLARVSELLSSVSAEATLLQSVCDLVVRHVNVTVAGIGQLGETAPFCIVGLSSKNARPEGEDPGAGMISSLDRTLLSRVTSRRQPVFLHDLGEEPPVGAYEKQAFPFRSLAVLPIYRKGLIWGVLAIGQAGEGVFDDPVLEGLLIELARNISTGLDRIDLLSRQRLLSSAMESVSEGVVITDPDSRILYTNNGFTAITGYKAEEVRGGTCRILQGTETDSATAHAIREAIRAGRPFHGQILNYRKDGTPFWNLLSISPVVDDQGKVVEFVGNQRDITSLIDLNRRLEYESLHDRLTDLPNRRALDHELSKALARSKRYRWSLAVAILDLDGFKPVNDHFGHEAGDRLLRNLAESISGALRKTDFLSRLGGDEFVLVIEHYGSESELTEILSRVDLAVRSPILVGPHQEVSVGVSMGVALYHPGSHEDNPEILLRSADQALYESKAHKNDRSRSWKVQGELLPLARNDVQQLLSEGRLEVHYQPIMANETGRIAGVEALARLRDHQGTLVFPDVFLPRLDEGDLFELSRQVLERAISDLPSLHAIVPDLWISVNVDPRSVSEGCIECLQRMLDEGRLDPACLYLEILEGQEFGETIVALGLLRRLKDLGVRLALDDLGSAYSSLLRLKDLPVDKVKLDQGFVRTLTARPKDLHFVEAILELSHRMGLRFTVEGVETEEILDAMRMLGADLLQGYALSHPLPLAPLQSFLEGFVPERAERPKTLFGLYALSDRIHGVHRRLLIESPNVLDLDGLVDNLHCPFRSMVEGLRIVSDKEILDLHAAYHAALGSIRTKALDHRRPLTEEDLFTSDRILEALAEAILRGEVHRGKG